jgi:hypothetical protein
MKTIKICIKKRISFGPTSIYQLPIPPNMGDDKNLDMNC